MRNFHVVPVDDIKTASVLWNPMFYAKEESWQKAASLIPVQ